ncbi:hypothetical protein [Salinisphaera aquimarina]|uniref:DUF2330 domain-containing protein n=1 Tax=Salinisphaera aquimarina TaxID=2094031 RepID=A0ABV7EKT3_9GAMM
MRRLVVRVCLLLCAAGAAHAAPGGTERSMEVVLEPASGDVVVVADLTIGTDGSYRLRYRDAPFAPHFLSMRPFQCLPAPPRLQCHLPYPYENGRRITDVDLGDLEYDLLFLVKQADEFGVDFWNGRYYRLAWEDDAIVGVAMATDMNILASSPPEGETRPIRNNDLTAIEPSDTPYPTLRIRHARGEQQ